MFCHAFITSLLAFWLFILFCFYFIFILILKTFLFKERFSFLLYLLKVNSAFVINLEKKSSIKIKKGTKQSESKKNQSIFFFLKHDDCLTMFENMENNEIEIYHKTLNILTIKLFKNKIVFCLCHYKNFRRKYK